MARIKNATIRRTRMKKLRRRVRGFFMSLVAGARHFSADALYSHNASSLRLHNASSLRLLCASSRC